MASARAPVVAWADGLGRPMNVRLVKGAYWDSEIKRTQVEGLCDYPLFTRKAATDVSYLACARDMLDATNIRPAFASHNALTVATIMEWAGKSRDFEFQRLHGMGEGLYERLVREEGYHCRIYAPVGGHRDLLAYLVRRLLENGANSSFVHQLADERLSEAEIARRSGREDRGGGRHAASEHSAAGRSVRREGHAIRRASTCSDVGDRWQRTATAVSAALGARLSRRCGRRPAGGVGSPRRRVARRRRLFRRWSPPPVDERARVPRPARRSARASTASELMAICVQEAFKTIPDAIGEVREAADFCRYYARERAGEAGAGGAARADRRAQRAAPGGPRRVGDDRAVEFPAGDLPGPDAPRRW